MPVRLVAPVLATVLLAACGGPAAVPTPEEPPPPSADPASGPVGEPATEQPAAPAVGVEPHEVSLIADFGPLPDGSGDAVVETVWTVDAGGTRQLLIDTPAGPAARHVMTDDEHWWWLHPSTRQTADAEWVHLDLRDVEQVGGELPEVVAEARVPLPPPGGIVVGQLVAGHEVLAVEVVGRDEAHLTVAGIERPVVHRRRRLPAGTTVEVPAGAVELADLPDISRP